jgi:hypothetical protein
MTKGEIVSRDAHRKRYKVVFTLEAVGKKRKHPVVGTVVSRTDFLLMIESADGTPIPDGEYDLHPEADKNIYHVVKSDQEWNLLPGA